MKRKGKSALVIVFVFIIATIFSNQVNAWSDFKQEKINRFTSYQPVNRVVLKKIEQSEDEPVFLENAYFNLYKKVNGEKILEQENLNTNHLGEIVLESLKEGEYLFKEILPPDGYTYELDKNGNIIDEFSFEITKNDRDIFLNVYNVKETGNLTIEKRVFLQEDIPRDSLNSEEEFKFKIDIEDHEILSYTINDELDLEIKNGGVITLKDGDIAKFYNLKLGAHYTVLEKESDDYDIESENSSGYVNTATAAKFSNYFMPNSSTLQISKTLHSSQETDQKKDVFHFKTEYDYEGKVFYQKDNDEWKLFNKEFTLTDGETIRIYGLPRGTSYIIEEIEDDYFSSIENISGMIGEELLQNYDIINYLKEEENSQFGQLTIEKQIVFSDKEDSFFFQVIFDTDEDILISEDGNNWEKWKGEELVINSNKTVYFKNIPHGTSYYISENSTDEYTPQVDSYEGTIIGGLTIPVIFKNEKIYDTSIIRISKKVENNFEEHPFNFTLKYNNTEEKFTLSDGESMEFKVPKNTKYEVVEDDYSNLGYETKIKNGNGTCNTKICEVMVVNQYKKQLDKVIIEGEKTWEYSHESEEIIPKSVTMFIYNGKNLVKTIDVTKDLNQRWLYSVELPRFNFDGTEILYSVKEKPLPGFKTRYEGFNVINTYFTPVKLKPTVTKIINNKPEKDEIFSFSIRSLNKNLFYHSNLKIEGEGKNRFKEIEFTEPGEFRFVISEIELENSQYSYDLTPVYMTVEIGEEKNQLFINNIIYEKDGTKNYESAIFINDFKISSIQDEPIKNEDAEQLQESNPDVTDQKELPITGKNIELLMKVALLLIIVGVISYILSLLLR